MLFEVYVTFRGFLRTTLRYSILAFSLVSAMGLAYVLVVAVAGWVW